MYNNCVSLFGEATKKERTAAKRENTMNNGQNMYFYCTYIQCAYMYKLKYIDCEISIKSS